MDGGIRDAMAFFVPIHASDALFLKYFPALEEPGLQFESSAYTPLCPSGRDLDASRSATDSSSYATSEVLSLAASKPSSNNAIFSSHASGYSVLLFSSCSSSKSGKSLSRSFIIIFISYIVSSTSLYSAKIFSI